MIRSLSLLVLAFAPFAAQAAHFQLSPQIIAVDQGQHTQELTLSLLPSPSTVGAEIDIKINLDRFGWVQVVPSWPGIGMQADCVLANGMVRATVVSATAFPTTQSIPLCRIRVRPHMSTPSGNYYTSYANGTSITLDGTAWSAPGNSVRVIVD